MRVRNLPPDAATVHLSRQAEADEKPAEQPKRDEGRKLAPVRYLEDIPVVSLREAGKFLQSSPDEFSRMVTEGEAG